MNPPGGAALPVIERSLGAHRPRSPDMTNAAMSGQHGWLRGPDHLGGNAAAL
jgi:hypothetical protein